MLNFNQKPKNHNMEIPNYETDTILDQDIYTLTWSDIENTEIDYENYLNEIEHFFKDDFENDILEEDIF